MKIFIRLILVALASWMMIMTSCKKDNNDNPPEDQYTLVASQLIGPAGGIISTNDVLLSIPANAVTYAVTLEIYSSTTENPFGDEGNSGVYWIKGLPDVLLSPVRLSVKYSGTLSDQSFIALGKYVIATSGADTTVSQDLLPATDSSGYLQAIIPASGWALRASTMACAQPGSTSVSLLSGTITAPCARGILSALKTVLNDTFKLSAISFCVNSNRRSMIAFCKI